MSRATELTEQLNAFGPRQAGGDAERRAAAWTAEQISTDPKRRAELETFWCRPNWAGAQAWHVALAVGGSLLATTQAKPGAAIIFVALVAILADWFTCVSPGRWLTRERASQNVVSPPLRDEGVHLIITANLDTGRLDPTHTRQVPGWLFWICLAVAWALVTALVRVEGGRSDVVAVLQLVPTVVLIVAGAWLLVSVRPGDNAQAVGAALGLCRILDAAPPANLVVDLVITGAGTGYGHGLRRYLRTRRASLGVTNTVVLGIGSGTGGYYLSTDGPLIPLSYFARLRTLAHETGMLTALTGRGCSPALPARLRRLPALTIGGDADTVVNSGLELVDAIDAYIGELAP